MKVEFISGDKPDEITRHFCGRPLGQPRTQMANVPMREIKYLFAGCMVRKGLISIPGVSAGCFVENRLYARISSDGVGVGVVEVNADVLHLDRNDFILTHQSCVVHRDAWNWLDLDEKFILFMMPGQPREGVPISRRKYRDVRKALGLSTRQRRRKWRNVRGRRRAGGKVVRTVKKSSSERVRVDRVIPPPSS